LFFWSKSIYITQLEKSLISNVHSISISLDSIENIQAKINKIHKVTNLRVTVIRKNGTVIAETNHEKKGMDNHKDRAEIIDAKYDGIGISIRYSNTIEKEFMYVAKKIKIDKNIYYLRLAEDLDVVEENFTNLTIQIIGIFSIFLLAAFVISYLISKKIQDETNIILKSVQNLSKKKTLVKEFEPITQEFDAIYKLLKKVANKLEKKEKIKAKHTAKLAQTNKQKDEIISAISHEFKNPLAVIDGFTQTLLTDEDLPPSMRTKFLQKIETSSNRMAQIIDKLRLSLKLEENKEKLDLRSLNLYNLTSQLASELEDKYIHRTIEVHGNKDLEIEADETLIAMAITNLIDNALKYSDDNVIVKIYNDGLSVKDSGIGIPEKELDKITGKFYRLSDNGWNNSLGLGLHIVFSIIKLHKFDLDIKSVYHEGSEFTIKF
jgi:signal transduction histidine kinase